MRSTFSYMNFTSVKYLKLESTVFGKFLQWFLLYMFATHLSLCFTYPFLTVTENNFHIKTLNLELLEINRGMEKKRKEQKGP